MTKSIEDQLVAHWADEQNSTFDMRTTIEGESFWNKPLTLDDVHTTMIYAGMSEGIEGRVADTIAFGTSIIQGNWGDAAWDAASIVPVFGFYVAQKRLEMGETIPLYRGMDVAPEPAVGGMIKGKSQMPEDVGGRLYVTTDPEVAYDFAGSIPGALKGSKTGEVSEQVIMKFEVPASYIKKNGVVETGYPAERAIYFDGGLPEKYLKGVAGIDDVLKTRMIKQVISEGKITRETVLDVSKDLPRSFGNPGQIKFDLKNAKPLYHKLLNDKSYVKNTLDDFLKTSHREVEEMAKRLKEINPNAKVFNADGNVVLAKEFVKHKIDPVEAKKLYETKLKTAPIELAIESTKKIQKESKEGSKAAQKAIKEAMEAIENIE